MKLHPLALAAALFVSAGHSATRTWDGNGASPYWSFVDAVTGNTNWEDKSPDGLPLPRTGDDLVFHRGPKLSSVNDLVGLRLAGMRFLAGGGAFVVEGEGIVNTGPIRSESSAAPEVRLFVTLGADQTWDTQGAGRLVMSGGFDLNDHRLTLSRGVHVDRSGSGLGLHGGRLVADQGARITSGRGLVLGNGTQSVLLTGSGTSWTNTDLRVADLVELRAGALMHSAMATAGNPFNPAGDQRLNAQGAGTLWRVDGSLRLEGAGRVEIEAGAELAVGSLDMFGRSNPAAPSRVRVSGAGTRFTHTGNVTLGSVDSAQFSWLRIDGGATASGSGASIGQSALSNGQVEIAGAGTRWSLSGALDVGARGTGVVTVSEGALLETGSSAVGINFANQSIADGSVVLHGAGTAWRNTGALDIGMQGRGRVTVSGGAQLSAGPVQVGRQERGELIVTGAGSRAELGMVNMGYSRFARIEVADGASLDSGPLRLDGGRLILRGAGTSARLDGLTVSSSGIATLSDGAKVVTGSLDIASRMEVTGGELYAGSLHGDGTLQWTGGTLRFDRLRIGDALREVDLPGPDTSRRLEVLGGLTVVEGGTLRVGADAPFSMGALDNQGDSRFDTTRGWALASLRNAGTLVFTQATALEAASTDTLLNRGDWRMAAGSSLQAGGGMLNIGRFEMAGAVHLRGTLENRGQWLQSGGDLRIDGDLLQHGSFSFESASGRLLLAGSLDNRGVLDLAGNTAPLAPPMLRNQGVLHAPAGLPLGTLQLVNSGELRFARSAVTAQAVELDGGRLWLQGGGLTTQHLRLAGELLLQDGATLRAEGLAFEGGRLAGAPLALEAIGGHLQGWGQIAGRVSGGPGTRITLARPVGAGGESLLGDATLDDGFAFRGDEIRVSGDFHTLRLMSATPIVLPPSVGLQGDYVVLGSAAGLQLPAGAVLAHGRIAAVDGPFVNDGRVQGEAAMPGEITFTGNVSGAGSFASGLVAFWRGASPGSEAQPLATWDFAGGDVEFGYEDAVLVLDIGAGGHDRLVGIDRLWFERGVFSLDLRFDASAAAAYADGGTLDLLDFRSFGGPGGGLDPARVRVSGLDRARVDLSGLTIDGRIHVSAVPEVPSAALLAAGLVLLMAGRRQATRARGGHATST